MSTQPAMPLSPAVLLARSAAGSRPKVAIGGLSATGVVLFVTSLLVVASGFTSMRPQIMGLSLHPFLIPVAMMFPFVLMSRITEFPLRLMAALLTFAGIYCFSVFNGRDIAIGEIFKTITSVITIVTCALLVRRRGDFVAGALGLSIAIALLAWHGLQEPTKSGVEAMQGANKNSYSLFALPAMLMAGFVTLRMPTVPTVVKGILIAGTLPALMAIFMSGNRSGYVGAVLVGLMLFWDRRGKGLLLVGFVTAVLAFALNHYGSTTLLDEKLKQTIEGNKSDGGRRDILLAALQIGLENPVIGVSPQQLPFEIGRVVAMMHGGSGSPIEAHNVAAHVFAASGVICFAAMGWVGWTMWRWKPRGGGKVGGKEDPLRDALRMMRMMLVLWVFRGMFTRDVIFNPSFNIGLGLSIGLCIVAEVARQGKAAAARPASLPPSLAEVALPGARA